MAEKVLIYKMDEFSTYSLVFNTRMLLFHLLTQPFSQSSPLRSLFIQRLHNESPNRSSYIELKHLFPMYVLCPNPVAINERTIPSPSVGIVIIQVRMRCGENRLIGLGKILLKHMLDMSRTERNISMYPNNLLSIPSNIMVLLQD